MKDFLNRNCSFLACSLFVLPAIMASVFSWTLVSPALAIAHQDVSITDSTPYLYTIPSQVSQASCQSQGNQTWTCVVTLYGGNITNAVNWSVMSPISSISFNPSTGILASLAFIKPVTISNIPCINTYFLFSGQVFGGGGVIPTTLNWSCTPKLSPTPTHQPTPLPTHQSTPFPTPQPSATPKATRPSPTPVKTPLSRIAPTVTLQTVISSGSQSNAPLIGNSDQSINVFIFSVLIFVTLVAIMELVIIVKMRRMIS